jgi:uncharacterized protein YbaR (Trm112 family)
MKEALLEIIVCPQCKRQLTYQATTQQLVCEHEKLAFPIRDGIPVLLVEEAAAC